MRVVVINPPAPLVSWADASTHLKLSGDAQKNEVEAMIAAASAHIDGPEGWLGRAIGVQTLEARSDLFVPSPCDSMTGLKLPFPSVTEVVSVTYVDGDGVVQTVASDQYELIGNEVVPAFGCTWPRPRAQREAVRIRYKTGYTDLPKPIRSAVLLMVGDLFRFRETALDGRAAGIAEIPMSTTVENLLAPYRVFA